MTGSPAAAPNWEELSQRINQAAWLQGSVFEPGAIGKFVPESVPIEAAELLILATQSCTVVSRNGKDAWVEAVVATPKPDYNPKTPAARGELVREFLLPVEGHKDHRALSCDINRRFFFPRSVLADFVPRPDLVLDQKVRRSFAAWLGRYYMRIALPDALGVRIKPFFEQVKKILRGNLPSGEPLHEQVIKVYIQWAPDSELASLDERYDVDLLFLCEKPEVAEHLDKALIPLIEANEPAKTGVGLKAISQPAAETFVTDLDDYVRLSEWDYLTNLGELGDHALGL